MVPPTDVEKRRRRARMLGWWYVCIGIAFTLLGLRSVIRGDPTGPVMLRFVIAAGFYVLAVGTLRAPNR